MSGALTDPPAGMAAPTWFLGFCDICRSVEAFDNAAARNQWENSHPHEDYAS